MTRLVLVRNDKPRSACANITVTAFDTKIARLESYSAPPIRRPFDKTRVAESYKLECRPVPRQADIRVSSALEFPRCSCDRERRGWERKTFQRVKAPLSNQRQPMARMSFHGCPLPRFTHRAAVTPCLTGLVHLSYTVKLAPNYDDLIPE